MPKKPRLYLVRFPNLRCAIILAKDEVDLVDIIDQVENPGDCYYQEYKGPLWIQVGLDVKHPTIEERGVKMLDGSKVDDSTDLTAQDLVVYLQQDAETVSEMEEYIREKAFPVYDAHRKRAEMVAGIICPDGEGEEHEKARFALTAGARLELELESKNEFPSLGLGWQSLAAALDLWYKKLDVG